MVLIPGDGEFGDGYGEEGEEQGLIIEQTSDFSGHYEIMALVREMAEIKELIMLSMEASRELQLEAQAVLAAHAESAQNYLRQVDEPVEPDFYPFETMPENTTVRDLPDGGRLFSLADGSFVRVTADDAMVAVSLTGEIVELKPEAGQVTLPDGPVLTIESNAIKETHEAVGVTGLPINIEPIMVAEGRYRFELSGDYRLDVSHADRTAIISNPNGTMLILGLTRIEGLGEEVMVNLIAGGAKGFNTPIGHRGVIEKDYTIRLAMANGLDLVIRFPDSILDANQSPNGDNLFTCETRQP